MQSAFFIDPSPRKFLWFLFVFMINGKLIELF